VEKVVVFHSVRSLPSIANFGFDFESWSRVKGSNAETPTGMNVPAGASLPEIDNGVGEAVLVKISLVLG
jgi:hypothetical protein